MGNIVGTVRRFSRNNAGAVPFQRYSSLSNGIPSTPPALNKCTCYKDSSVTAKIASAVNAVANGCKPVCKDVDNETMGLTTCSSSRSGCFTLSIAHTEPCGGDDANKGQGKPNETIHTDAVEHRSVSRPDSAGLICNHTADRMPHNLESGSTKKISLTAVISEDHFSTVSPEENYSTNPVVAEGVIKSPARDTHKCKELRLHSVSPGSTLFDRDASKKLIGGNLNMGFKSIPEASVNREMVPFEDRAVCGPLDVRGSESSPKASMKRRAKRKRTNRKVSTKMIVPTESLGTLASPDVKYPETARSPLTRSKATALSVSTPEYHNLRSTRMGHPVVPPSDSESPSIISYVEKLPIIPSVEQSSADKALQVTPLRIRTPLPHVGSSPTPSKAKVLSVPTLETLQLRSSRSGRMILPPLDPATQNIIYNTDGSIGGVTNSELQLPQGCESERPAKRRRKSQCPTPYRGKSLQFDGKI